MPRHLNTAAPYDGHTHGTAWDTCAEHTYHLGERPRHPTHHTNEPKPRSRSSSCASGAVSREAVRTAELQWQRLVRPSVAAHVPASCASCPLIEAVACGGRERNGGDAKSDPEAAAVQPAAGDDRHAEARGGALHAVAVSGRQLARVRLVAHDPGRLPSASRRRQVHTTVRRGIGSRLCAGSREAKGP